VCFVAGLALGSTTSLIGFSVLRMPCRRAYRNAPDGNDLRCANDVRFKFSVRAMARNKFSPSTVLKSLSAIMLLDFRCRDHICV
jgi:hypothetical protein